MIKFILSVLVVFNLSYAQYGNNLYSNPGFETSGSDTWTAWNGGSFTFVTIQAYSGSYSAEMTTSSNASNSGLAQIKNSATVGQVYRNRGWLYSDGVNAIHAFIWNGSAYKFSSPDQTTAGWVYHSVEHTMTGTSLTGGFSKKNNAGTVVFYVDDTDLRLKMPEIYVNSGAGNDNNLGDAVSPIKTAAECFNVRGLHTGGNVFLTGTFNESVVIDSSFGKISAVGNASIQEIDFAGNTGTVDLSGLTISSKLNDQNIIYIISRTRTSYPVYNKYPSQEE